MSPRPSISTDAPTGASNDRPRGSTMADKAVSGQASGISPSESSGSAAPSSRRGQRDGADDSDQLPITSNPASIRGRGGDARKRWIPFPVRRLGVAIVTWAKGPPDPQPYRINPLFPKVQQFPLWLLDRFLPHLWQRVLLAVVYLAMWATALAMVIRLGQQASEVPGLGEPLALGCGSSYWNTGNGCGIDGMNCRPFNGTGLAFRCPANCASYRVLNPRAVGDQEVIYQPLVVGGPPDPGSSDNAFYRGDSHICSSAIHSGFVSNNNGGCGVLWLTGQRSGFVASERNDIKSVGFDAAFPLSFTFLDEKCESRDLRWPLLGLSVAFSSVFSLFVSSAPRFFFSIFTGVFWHVGMVSDPPGHSSIAGLASNIVGKFLPGAIVAWVIYDRLGVRRTLTGLTAQVEKTILWLGGCWLGALENYSFSEWIPITRLTGRDLEQQPGAKAALAFIVIILVVVVVTQVYFFRQEGRLLRYLQVYLLFVAGLVICLVLPDLNLRVHHYILALLLLPGTSMQTRPSLFYQGLLVGLFINGIARWGFDSILQTPGALQGDGQYFSDLPSILAPAISLASSNSGGGGGNLSTISFTWAIPPVDELMDGISVLVNDVERYRGFFRDNSGGDLGMDGRRFEWKRPAGAEVNEYFRFAYMIGSSNLDYTKAGLWNKQGEWVQMAAGPSKHKKRSLGAVVDGGPEGRSWMRN